MSQLLDQRSGFRFPIVVAGAMLATGRRTASSWFRAAGVGDDWDRFYDLLATIGKHATSLATPILKVIVTRFDPGPNGYWKIAIDDTPTKGDLARMSKQRTCITIDRPWDNPDRRPSHVDRRRKIKHKMLRNRFLNDLPQSIDESKMVHPGSSWECTQDGDFWRHADGVQSAWYVPKIAKN